MSPEVRMQELLADLEVLSNEIGVSGFESAVRDQISSRVESFADEIRRDALGNLLVVKQGTSERPRVLLDAHMDEIGFIVSHIDDKGFIRFEKLGGWDDRTLLGHPVRFMTCQGHRDGVIGTKPPHLQRPDEVEKTVKLEQMFVDVGARTGEEARSIGIDVGSPFTINHPFQTLGEEHLMGKAFDDRVGCAILIDVIRRLDQVEHTGTVVFNFSVCEEVGIRGATTGAYALDPDIALAIENTAAGDIPGVAPERCPSELGKGPAITIADKSLVAHPDVVSRLKSAAEARGVPYQIKKPLYGGTDAGKIAVTRAGIPSGVLSVPCRYIHNGISLLRLQDLEQTARVALGFCLDSW